MITTWSLLYLLIWSIDTNVLSSTSIYPNSIATFIIFSILLPDTATFLPYTEAACIICWILWILEANVAIIILPLVFPNILIKLSPTIFSDFVYPGFSTLVESAIIAKTPFLPNSANLAKSIGSPSIGV